MIKLFSVIIVLFFVSQIVSASDCFENDEGDFICHHPTQNTLKIYQNNYEESPFSTEIFLEDILMFEVKRVYNFSKYWEKNTQEDADAYKQKIKTLGDIGTLLKNDCQALLHEKRQELMTLDRMVVSTVSCEIRSFMNGEFAVGRIYYQ